MVCGSMFSGKTEELIRRIKRARIAQQQVKIFKPCIDTRYSDVEVVSHDSQSVASVPVASAAEMVSLAHAADVVGVDEAQFLTREQVDQLMKVTTDLDIPVMAYGLRLNFRLTDGGFEGATRLLQMAHDIDEIKTICECGRKATLNARFLNGKFLADGPDVLIDDGTSEVEYRAICPKCYAEYAAGKKC